MTRAHARRAAPRRRQHPRRHRRPAQPCHKATGQSPPARPAVARFAQESHARVPLKEETPMRKPDTGLPGNADDDWPYVPPEHLPIYADPGDATPGEADWPRTEWSHDGVLPSDPAAWDSPQELEPPPGWTTGGTYVPGNGGRPPWDDPDQD